jgi:hypothetical protein
MITFSLLLTYEVAMVGSIEMWRKCGIHPLIKLILESYDSENACYFKKNLREG